MNVKKETSFQTQWEQEIEKRICEIESPSYVFPKKFKKRDYIISICVAGICLILIIWGAYLP